MPRTTKIYGAPGTGKTTKMLDLLDEELKRGTRLDRIAFVTHTVAARQEAVDRVRARFPQATDEDLRYFRTIHGICFKQSNLERGQVVTPSDYVEFGRANCIEFSDGNTKMLDEDGLPYGWNLSAGSQMMAMRQLASALMLPWNDRRVFPDLLNERVTLAELQRTFDLYEKWKKQSGKYDFVDMLDTYHLAGQPLDVDVMFIDEAQDLSKLQWVIVAKMYADAARVYLAGDDDQSIYAFIGADRNAFYEYAADDKTVLPYSYRLKAAIWHLALGIIQRVRHREPKPISVAADLDGGKRISHWGRSIWDLPHNEPALQYDDIMIICRTHAIAGDVEDWLKFRDIPYVSIKGEKGHVQKDKAKVVYAYWQLRKGKDIPLKDAAKLLRDARIKDHRAVADRARANPGAVMTPQEAVALGLQLTRQDWDKYLARNDADFERNKKLRRMMNRAGTHDVLVREPKVKLTTYHASKGREAQSVILLRDSSPAAYNYELRNPDDARRLAYVGVTRAKEHMLLVEPSRTEEMRGFHA